MSAFQDFIERLDRMIENGTTSYHMVEREAKQFAYYVLPSLKAAGLPEDYDQCLQAIRDGEFQMNGIKICTAKCERVRGAFR